MEQTARSSASAQSKSRLEARIDSELERLITQAARKQGVSKTAFVSEAIRDAALKVLARADVTLMSAETFDRMMASLDVPDRSAELEELAALPRVIS